MTFVVGLTGGIGSGKSTVANTFFREGITVIDADVIARQVVEVGSDALITIGKKFGNNILNHDASLNRSALREYIFTHPDDKAWLNALLHPIIKQIMLSQIKTVTSAYCLLVAPLLLENGLDAFCQRVLVVDTSEESQIQRTIKRDNLNMTQVQNIIASQLNRKARLAIADDVVKNDNSEMELFTQVIALHRKYLVLADKTQSSPQ